MKQQIVEVVDHFIKEVELSQCLPLEFKGLSELFILNLLCLNLSQLASHRVTVLRETIQVFLDGTYDLFPLLLQLL